MKYRGCLGRKMYSDSTLKSCTKDELIEFLHIAERNYRNLEETYDLSVDNSIKAFGYYEEAFLKACTILDNLTGGGYLQSPMEWLETCGIITDCTNVNWKIALIEKVKEERRKAINEQV